MLRSRLVCRRAATQLRPRASIHRNNSSNSENRRVPAAYDKDLANDAPSYHHFSDNAVFTLDVLRRFLKFSAIGVVAVGLATFTFYEGSHQYVELSSLAKETDPDVKKWGWDRDGGEEWRWSGGDNGGTDPNLGLKASHAVRSAWMALNWPLASSGSVINSKAFSGRGGGGVSMVEARLEMAQEFLTIAINLAKARADRLHPDTLPTLLARHAGILERMGTRDALFECRSEYEQVWHALPAQALDPARVALKLGDLNKRLGDEADALSWWSRAIHLAADTPDPTPAVPPTLPASPLAQRTLAQTLVSLSAYYATTNQLKPASALESAALALLTPALTAPTPPTAYPAHTLHTLFLRHRAALLALHRAEVAHALRAADTPWCAAQLESAARASEGVVLALTGAPAVHPDAPESAIPHPPVPEGERALLRAWGDSQSMRRPAGSLLRDARRSAAEAWNLVGVLCEGVGRQKGKGDVERALECYERALGWAGVKADRVGNVAEPGEATLEAEWRVLWGNYVRVREVVMKAREQTGRR